MINRTIRYVVLDVLRNAKEQDDRGQEFIFQVALDLACERHNIDVHINEIYSYFGVKDFNQLIDMKDEVISMIAEYRKKLSNLDNPRVDMSTEFLPKWWFGTENKKPGLNSLIGTIQDSENIKSAAHKILLQLF